MHKAVADLHVESCLHFGMGSRIVWNSQRNHGSRWTASEVEMENERISMRGELCSLFPFSFLLIASVLYHDFDGTWCVHSFV